jgi:hypothetical protein
MRGYKRPRDVISPSNVFLHSVQNCLIFLMGRWPDNRRSNLIAFALIFVLFPLLAWACVWFMRR